MISNLAEQTKSTDPYIIWITKQINNAPTWSERCVLKQALQKYKECKTQEA